MRDIDQLGTPERHDRQHLHLIARCVPKFLRDVHAAAVADLTREKEALKVFTRAFKMLQQEKFTATLFKEGIAPRSLLPAEFAQSPLERIRKAYQWQLSLVPAEGSAPPLKPTVAPPPKPRQGPRCGL